MRNWIQHFGQTGLLILILLLVPACLEKKCQQPPAERFQTITATEWRLVETNDPTFKNLNNTTFLVFKFDKNYTGAINAVKNNDLFDTPVYTFKYNIAPGDGLIRVKYDATTVQAEGEGEAAAAEPPSSSPIDYNYDLGRELEMTSTQNGAYYRFVPFQGIVDPDNNCTF